MDIMKSSFVGARVLAVAGLGSAPASAEMFKRKRPD
jgi:hypothetical protein